MGIPKKRGLTVWERIRFIAWPSVQNWATPLRLVGLLILVGTIVGAWASYLTIHPEGFQLVTFVADFYANASTELGSIAITVLVLDTLNENRAKQERIKAVIRQMASPVNAAALEAVRMADDEGWLEDGTLKDAHLLGANLENAYLQMAYLKRANLPFANLQEANLVEANLEGARLVLTNLTRARLAYANLTMANLHAAKLERADLRYANLRAANLEIAILDNACFNDSTVLPDGTHWTPRIDMERFINPQHPAFWRSDDPRSPACPENDESEPWAKTIPVVSSRRRMKKGHLRVTNSPVRKLRKRRKETANPKGDIP